MNQKAEKMTHPDIEDLIKLIEYPELNQKRPDLVEHLSECGECSLKLSELKLLRGLLRNSELSYFLPKLGECPSDEQLLKIYWRRQRTGVLQKSEHIRGCVRCRNYFFVLNKLMDSARSYSPLAYKPYPAEKRGGRKNFEQIRVPVTWFIILFIIAAIFIVMSMWSERILLDRAARITRSDFAFEFMKPVDESSKREDMDRYVVMQHVWHAAENIIISEVPDALLEKELRGFVMNLPEEESDAELQFLLGIAALAQARHQEAIDHLERAVDLKPGNGNYRNFLMKAYIRAAIEQRRETYSNE